MKCIETRAVRRSEFWEFIRVSYFSQCFFETHSRGKFPPEIFVDVNFWTSFRHFLPIQLFFLRAFVKNVAARCDFQAQNTPKCVCGRGFAPDPTGELTELPDPLAGFQEPLRGRGGEEWGEGGKEENGSVPHFFYLQFNDCLALIVTATYTRSLDLALQLVCSSVCRHHADWLWIFWQFLEFKRTNEVQ